MTKKSSAFVAYPSAPREVGSCIVAVGERLRSHDSRLVLHPWEQNDIAGRPLVAPIFEGIRTNDFLIADVTTLNFNVTYEIGYAIGNAKRAYLIRHSGIKSDEHEVRRVGIFDTLGYENYKDADDLFKKLSYPIDLSPVAIRSNLDRKAPLYLIETPVRTESMSMIASRVKKARLQYRSFTPSENSRLAAMEAIRHVSDSFGVLIPLLSDAFQDARVHNIRAAFVAGLAHGMNKRTLILQNGEDPVPLDVRDFATVFKHPADLKDHIEALAMNVYGDLQTTDDLKLPATNLLAAMFIGDPMAENEFQTLENYYVQTDAFLRTLRGEVNLVVGRKGTGKTALFSQVRNRIRRDKQNIVVDLKPEGYQLLKLKDEVLNYLKLGAKAHLVTAFWEYVLYLEVCYKVLEKDKERYLRDHHLTEKYNILSAVYLSGSSGIQGDFSERLNALSEGIALQYLREHRDEQDVALSTGEVTKLIHRHDLSALRQRLSDYLCEKGAVWILFDNLDKGWSATGPSADDIIILRCLIDAGRRIQHEMQQDEHDFHCVVFIRNDVYQLLMDETADFGKEMKTSLDWNDPDLLREMLRQRLVQNELPRDAEFGQVWNKICVSHFDGQESSQYLIDRSLMRPRNMIKMLAHCRGSAVNLNHAVIEATDIEKGLRNYSLDLLIEADQELADIEPSASGLIYQFFHEATDFAADEFKILMEINGIAPQRMDDILEYLLYYGFVGVRVGSNDPQFVFDVGYDTKLLKIIIGKHPNALRYSINPAFWPALEISSDGRAKH